MLIKENDLIYKKIEKNNIDYFNKWCNADLIIMALTKFTKQEIVDFAKEFYKFEAPIIFTIKKETYGLLDRIQFKCNKANHD